MNMRDLINLFEAEGSNQTGPVTLYHITDTPRFKLNPNFEPEDNAISYHDRSKQKGIYLARDVEAWVNGHGYIRPFVVEFLADRSVIENDRIGRFGGEVFVPADQFDKLKIVRVVPIDAIAREQFGSHGWIEGEHGHEFDTGNPITAKYWETPFRDWKYDRDTRTMTPDELKRLKKHFSVGYKKRTGNR